MTTQNSGKVSGALRSRAMRYAGVREPSPPFGHVSWHERADRAAEHLEVEHDAAHDMVVLAETVMGRDGAPSPPRPAAYLAKIARYPLWAISVRALVGFAVLPVPLFLYGAARYHYVVTGRGGSHFDQNTLLAGVGFALVGSLVGMLIGAVWGLIVVRHPRGSVRRLSQHRGGTGAGR